MTEEVKAVDDHKCECAYCKSGDTREERIAEAVKAGKRLWELLKEEGEK